MGPLSGARLPARPVPRQPWAGRVARARPDADRARQRTRVRRCRRQPRPHRLDAGRRPDPGVRRGNRTVDVRGRSAAGRHPAGLRAARLVSPGGAGHPVRHRRRPDRRRRPRQEPSPRRHVRRPRRSAVDRNGGRRGDGMQPHDEPRTPARRHRRDGAYGRDPLRRVPPAADRDRVHHAGGRAGRKSRRVDGAVRGVARLALLRRLDRRPRAGASAGARPGAARPAAGAPRPARAARGGSPARRAGRDAHGPGRDPVGAPQPRVHRHLQRAVPRHGTRARRGARPCTTRRSSSPSTASERGTASTAGGDSSSISACCPGARAAASVRCWPASPLRSRPARWPCSSSSGRDGRACCRFRWRAIRSPSIFRCAPARSKLLDALDEITHAHGGRVYLAKDACCTPERVRRGYPEWEAFRDVRAEAAGSAPRFASGLSRRLAL